MTRKDLKAMPDFWAMYKYSLGRNWPIHQDFMGRNGYLKRILLRLKFLMVLSPLIRLSNSHSRVQLHKTDSSYRWSVSVLVWGIKVELACSNQKAIFVELVSGLAGFANQPGDWQYAVPSKWLSPVLSLHAVL